jgi:hypothetical protein
MLRIKKMFLHPCAYFILATALTFSILLIVFDIGTLETSRPQVPVLKTIFNYFNLKFAVSIQTHLIFDSLLFFATLIALFLWMANAKPWEEELSKKP